MKSWLGPEAISKLRFASKSEVQTFIGPEYLPPHMGGTVCYYSSLNVQYCNCPTSYGMFYTEHILQIHMQHPQSSRLWC